MPIPDDDEEVTSWLSERIDKAVTKAMDGFLSSLVYDDQPPPPDASGSTTPPPPKDDSTKTTPPPSSPPSGGSPASSDSDQKPKESVGSKFLKGVFGV